MRVKLAYRVKKFILLCTVLLLLTPALAQQRHNYLAVNGESLADEAGPYYFIEQGNNKDAFAKARPLAEALGVSLKQDESGDLVFSQGDRTARLQATSDIYHGLETRAGTLEVGGELRDSPLGIVVEGESYVAVDPVVKAFGGSSEFDPNSYVLFIDTAPPPVQASAPLSAPRYGFQESSSRVALNLPEDTPFEVLVTDNRLAVKLPGLDTGTFRRDLDDPFLQSMYFATVEETPALVVDTHYPLDAAGQGYRVGILPPAEAHPGEEVLFIDFAPDLWGESATSLTQAPGAAQPPAENSTALNPAALKKVVIIDAGHGGKDPGAVSPYVYEKDVVLSVALKLAALLEQQGIKVIMTRNNDTFIPLPERSHSASPEVNLFLSIHVNAEPNTSASGIETWVFGEPLRDDQIALAIEENGGGSAGLARTQEALSAARNVTGDIIRQGQYGYSMQLAQMVQDELISATGANDRGVRPNAFSVLREARSPSILVELGFVSHPEEGRKLASESYQASLAEALANGVTDFLDQGSSVAER